jgi:four helix bundle protein
MARDFRSIKAWQHAYQLTLRIYRATDSFPQAERFGITSQVRRSAASVAANIAEGSSRSAKNDYLRFLEIALGSLRETECFLMLARDLSFLEKPACLELEAQADETARTLSGLISHIRSE